MDQSKSPYQDISLVYDMIRPAYPKALLEDILRETKLNNNGKMLEIGAGTGKATTEFISKGFYVDAIELEKNMADILAGKVDSSNLKLYVTSFEAWQPVASDYDLIICAQAFHWLDPDIKFKKCHSLLSNSGFLALFWYDPLPPVEDDTNVRLEAIKQSFLGSTTNYSSTHSADNREKELRHTEYFDLIFEKRYDVTVKNTAEQYFLAMQSTPAFSEKYNALSVEVQQDFIRQINAVISDNDGFVASRLRYSLYILKPTN